ncbi:MAG: LPS export ABC transporter ATP-binding protein [Gammaproteobacteria bacterium]|nr:LPS export ABC transporter ATP-binding protein [Gammaproteobacteria bacterium]
MSSPSHFYARGLAKSYQKRQVVTSVDIDVYSGQVVGLLGPNGAGKTTTFYMMTGLVENDDGQIFLDDQEISQLAIHQRAKLGIGYLPQEASVFRKLNVTENIMAILEMRPELTQKKRKHIFNSLVDDLQIRHILEQPGQALSGGERRRVEIARALAMEPRFILLDEPFAGVDPISVKDIQSIILHLKNKNIGVLITDHNVREILGVCDYAYILHAGTILASGTPDEVLAHEEVKRVYLGNDFK